MEKNLFGTEANYSAADVSGPHLLSLRFRYFNRPTTTVNLYASNFPLCLKEIFNNPYNLEYSTIPHIKYT